MKKQSTKSKAKAKKQIRKKRSVEDVRAHVRFEQGRDKDHATTLVACKVSSSSALRRPGSSL